MCLRMPRYGQLRHVMFGDVGVGWRKSRYNQIEKWDYSMNSSPVDLGCVRTCRQHG